MRRSKRRSKVRHGWMRLSLRTAICGRNFFFQPRMLPSRRKLFFCERETFAAAPDRRMFNDTQDLSGGSAALAPATVPDAIARARSLEGRYGTLPASRLLEAMLRDVFPGRVALVSSFGVESAVLLHLVAGIDPSTPVLFLDTGKLFEQTRRYRQDLIDRLGLTGVRVLHPDPAALAEEDRDGTLWKFLPDHCCHLRKVVPLAAGLAGFDAWITGRKRFQGATRATLPAVEADADGRIKINPLADWTPAEIAAYFRVHDLPRHSLEADGYRSIGCLPCTDRVRPGEDPRAGRWRHSAKTECGIHRPTPPFGACF
jgi:phosphoadenosine phosphosulfate reductase